MNNIEEADQRELEILSRTVKSGAAELIRIVNCPCHGAGQEMKESSVIGRFGKASCGCDYPTRVIWQDLIDGHGIRWANSKGTLMLTPVAYFALRDKVAHD
jgi:hypothetical protein